MNELRNDRNAAGTDIAESARPETNTRAITDPFVDTDASGDTRTDQDIKNQDIKNSRDIAYGQRTGSESQSVARESRQPQPNALFPTNELHHFRSDWDQVQASFVDEPRAAVKQADTLVANVVNRLTAQFASEREQLEQQWARGEDANTENLRQALKRYRAFFDRLLSFNGEEQ